MVYAAQGIAALAIVLAWSFDPADFGDMAWLLGAAQVLPFIVAPLIGVPVLAFFTAIFWVMSLILGGRGSYSVLFAGLAFASVPTVFSLPANLLVSHSAIEGRCDRVLRLFVEAILAAPYDQCQAGQPVALQAAGRANRSSICAASRSSLSESTGDTNKGGTGVYMPC